jgi:hypothetical protein
MSLRCIIEAVSREAVYHVMKGTNGYVAHLRGLDVEIRLLGKVKHH